MTNLLFFLWMLLYPICSVLESVLQSFVYKLRDQDPPENSNAGSILEVALYFIVGFLLFKFQ